MLRNFHKVPPDPTVPTAAQTLGNRTLDPEHLREVVQGRFADALGEVAAKMTQMKYKRIEDSL